MIKSDILYQIDLRLREIKQTNKDFGGVSIILFGDPLQLKPVMGRYPWQPPISQKYQEVYCIQSLWSLFEPIILRTNHRQGDDKEYSEILNRIRENKQTDCDLEKLRLRVVPRTFDKIPEDRIYVFVRNRDVNEKNEEFLENLEGDLISVEAFVQHPTLKNYKPKIENTGNIANTNLQQTFKFKVGCKVMLTYNLNTCDSLVNGSHGVIIEIGYNDKSKISEIHVDFKNKCGKETAKKYPDLEKKYGVPVVPIKMYEAVYRIGRENVGVKSTATAVQYPLKLAFSVTSHKVIFHQS